MQLRKGPNIRLRTAYGTPLTALEAGGYKFVVDDASRTDNVHLVGPGTNLSTGLTFTGTATWTASLASGTYRYRSDRPGSKRAGSFVVLRPG